MLFAAAGGLGHLQPLLPLADEAVRAGHDVLVTGAASLSRHATARGLAFAATGPDLEPVHTPLVVRDLDEERRAVAGHFVARLGHRRAAAVLDLCRSWRPDVVVRDEVDVGAAVAAEVTGLPHVAVVVIGAGGFLIPELLGAPLSDLRAASGLERERGVAMLHRHLTLTPFPTSFRDPADPLPGQVLGYRVPTPGGTHHGRAGRNVYVTLGTIFNTESGDLLRTASLAAASAAGVERVIVATGEQLDPASLGALPDHVEVHRFVRQDHVLAECDALVSHAGSGTVLDALRHALPMVSLPIGADQHLNAARLRALGLGVSLAAGTATADDIREALDEALASPAIRRALSGVRRTIDALPGPERALRAVEDLVTT